MEFSVVLSDRVACNKRKIKIIGTECAMHFAFIPNLQTVLEQ
jgi:hypothetical protein